MRQLLQDLRSGELQMAEVPPPSLLPKGVLVRNAASFISSGTERTLVSLGGKSLLGKALERPDLVRQVLNRVKTNGIADTLSAVRARLDSSLPLGNSSAGRSEEHTSEL